MYKTKLEIKIINACLNAVSNAICTNDAGECYIDKNKFKYELLSNDEVITLKLLARNY